MEFSGFLLFTNCLSVFDHFVGLALKGLNLVSFLSVTYTRKTCRNGPRRFDLENKFTLLSVGILFCGGDYFLLSELPFWLSKGSLCRRVWCFCLQSSTRHLNSDWHSFNRWALDKQLKHIFCYLTKFFLSKAVFFFF